MLWLAAKDSKRGRFLIIQICEVYRIGAAVQIVCCFVDFVMFRNDRLSALGQKETSSEFVSDVRFGAVSGHRTPNF